MVAEIDTESIAEEIAQFHRRLRRRLEGWLVRRRRLSEASRRARAVVLGQRRDGRCAREDGKHPVSAPGPEMHVEPRGIGPRGEVGDVADARAAADARLVRSPYAP
jgi:hypothetical protein